MSINQRVRWVAGGVFTGTVINILAEDTVISGYIFDHKGDLVVQPDKPQYKGQQVILDPNSVEVA